MTQAIRELQPTEAKGVNLPAALARAQLLYAKEILESAYPTINVDPLAVVTFAQAIATNYAANQRHG